MQGRGLGKEEELWAIPEIASAADSLEMEIQGWKSQNSMHVISLIAGWVHTVLLRMDSWPYSLGKFIITF